MIPMEKDKRLLAKYNEYGVTKFGHFGQDEHCGPESGHFIVLDITVKYMFISPVELSLL